MQSTKQIIVVRRDLNMSVGKTAAQVAHASMSFLTKEGKMIWDEEYGEYGSQFTTYSFMNINGWMKKNFDEIDDWLKNSFKKIVVYVDSEEQLMEIDQLAIMSGLMSYLIEDNGATEFNGVLTKTCVAIGPHWDEKFVGITDKLPLLR